MNGGHPEGCTVDKRDSSALGERLVADRAGGCRCGSGSWRVCHLITYLYCNKKDVSPI
jgi:hypothetical protein